MQTIHTTRKHAHDEQTKGKNQRRLTHISTSPLLPCRRVVACPSHRALTRCSSSLVCTHVKSLPHSFPSTCP